MAENYIKTARIYLLTFTRCSNKKISYINMIPKKQNIIKNVYKNYTGYLSTKMKTN